MTHYDEFRGKRELLREGSTVKNNLTGELCKVKFGECMSTGRKSGVLCYVKLKSGEAYLVGIRNKLFNDIWSLVEY